VKADLNSPKKTALNLPIVLAKLDEFKSPKLETLEWWKADLNRPKEGSIKSPNSQMAKLDELDSFPKLETVE